MIASLVDQATNLADRATSYPLPVKIFFVLTFVAALVSVFVYALLYPTATPAGEQAAPSNEPAQ